MTQWKALGFNPDRCTHIGRGLSGCEAIFQNVARWEPGHRLEAYATLACRRGCRWSADLPAGAFETSFQHSGKLMYHRLPACVGFPTAFPRREPSQTTLIFAPFNPGLNPWLANGLAETETGRTAEYD